MTNIVARFKFGFDATLSDADVEAAILAGETALGEDGSVQIGGVAVDNSDNVYVTDSARHAIFKVYTSGKVELFAGQVGTAGGNNGSINVDAASALFNTPRGITVDNSGNVYVCDSGNNQIRKIAGGKVSWVAGAASYASGNADGASATLNTPWDIVVNNSGDIIFSDYGNHSVRRVRGGEVYTIAGGLAGDQDNVSATTNQIFQGPKGIGVNRRGDIFVCDSLNFKIKKIDPRGWIYLFSGAGTAGTSLGTAGTTKQFTCQYQNPIGLATDSNSVYVIDLGAADTTRILRLSADGVPAIVGEFSGGTYGESVFDIALGKGQEMIVGMSAETGLISSDSSSSSVNSSSSSVNSSSSSSSSVNSSSSSSSSSSSVNSSSSSSSSVNSSSSSSSSSMI